MRHRTTATACLALFVTLAAGCASTAPSDTTATDALGQQAINVLREPTRIAGWNFQAPGGAVYNDPELRPLDIGVAKELRDILLDDSTYAKVGSGGGFTRDVGFRVWRNNESIDVLLSLSADLMVVKTPAYGGQSTVNLSADVTNAHKRLVKLAKRAFPEFKEVGRSGK